jgi:hypothetical protein
MEGLWAVAKTCGWWWPFKDVCVLTAKPILLKRDHEGRLHSADSKAIQYPDGWGLYRWHGVEVKEDVILHPELITTSDIESESNLEVKRVLLERYGEARYLEDSGAELIQEDHFGKLFRKEIKEDEPLVMVRVINTTPEPDGSHKPYFLRVLPTVKSAHEAVAWTFGLKPEQYQPEQES